MDIQMPKTEDALLNLHSKLLDKQENTKSDSKIRVYQKTRKNIRDKLVEDFDYTRKEANQLSAATF
jgi:hypothetical protein